MSGNTTVQYFPLSTPLFRVTYTTLVTRSDERVGTGWQLPAAGITITVTRQECGATKSRSLNRSLTISCCQIRIHTYTVHEHLVILPALKFASAVEGYRKW